MTTEKKYPLPAQEVEDTEEALGMIWRQSELGIHAKKEVLTLLEDAVSPDIYAKLKSKGLVREEAENIALTREGNQLARDVARRHRLAERLLSDVLALSTQAIDPNACQLEHIISPEVAESICTLLGHPQQCPHGSPIPPGKCCEKVAETLSPIIVSLDKLEAGSKGRIAYLLLQNHPDLHKLLSLGLIPGTPFNLHQTFPTYVIEIGETTVALEKEIAEKIFIRRSL
ncbi:MAG: FeoA domain-containing protein [Elusimicrobia bacterium]|nr:FeoA domain-containing protein [Elusimicrobiota bacterium]